jgi:hypothetical protein
MQKQKKIINIFFNFFKYFQKKYLKKFKLSSNIIFILLNIFFKDVKDMLV